MRGRDANGRRVYAYPDEENGYEPKRGTGKLLISSEDAACFARLELQAAGCSDVAIFRVHPGGREERLPSYEEALAMRPAVVLVCRDCGAEVERGQRCKAAGCVDPLAALEAAERRLLEAGGWTIAEPDEYGGERWNHEEAGKEARSTAIVIARRMAEIERRRLAAKGCA